MMYKYCLFLLLVLLIIGCTNSVSKKSDATSQFAKIEVPAFKAKLQSLTNEQLVDVRTPEEFNAGAIPNAVNLNFYDKNFKEQLSQLDKSKPVMVYCKSGGRSGKSLAILKELGFTEAYDLIGGYTAWSKTK